MNKNIMLIKRINRFILSIFLIIFILGLSSCSKTIEIDGVKAEVVNIHTNMQQNYLAGDYNQYNQYASGIAELSLPQSITVKWDKDIGENGFLYFSEDKNFTKKISYPANGKEASINNLKIKTLYYYKAVSQDGSIESKVKNLYVDENCIRNLNIPGLTNVRDLGGWTTIDGIVTNQDLLIRSSKLNDDESTTNLITQEGIDILNNQFKIKTELDLRTVDDNENGGITKSPLGDEVNYISFPMESGGNIMNLNKNKWKDLFAILGNEDNYPILFHCSIGTDRTGCVAFILNALLNVSDEDLHKDYLFSNFGNIGSSRTANALDKNYYFILNAYNGSTKEKAIEYLLSQDVKREDIDNFIRIMTQKN